MLGRTTLKKVAKNCLIFCKRNVAILDNFSQKMSLFILLKRSILLNVSILFKLPRIPRIHVEVYCYYVGSKTKQINVL